MSVTVVNTQWPLLLTDNSLLPATAVLIIAFIPFLASTEAPEPGLVTRVHGTAVCYQTGSSNYSLCEHLRSCAVKQQQQL